MGILRSIQEHLPTIRKPETQYNTELIDNRVQKIQYTPTQKRYLALENKDVQKCTQIYKDTALACGYTLDTDTAEDDNPITNQYLQRVFEQPEGYNSTMTYPDMNSLIWDSLLVMGDCFFEISTDPDYNILNGFRYIHNNAIMWNNENECYQLREKPEVQYENYELIHMKRPDIRRENSPWGRSIIDGCARYIALLESALTYNNSILNNGGLDPHTILSYDKDMNHQAFQSEVKRLGVLKKKQQRQGNSEKGIIAVKGATVQKASTSNKEMSYLELMKFARDNIIQAFGVPPQLAGIIETANLGSGSGDSQKKDWKMTFEGESRIVENAFNNCLKYHGFQEKFKYGTIDAVDEMYDAQVAEIYIRTGIKTRDEIRNEMGLDKIENSWSGYW